MIRHKLNYFLVLILLTVSCTTRGVYKNQPNDKADAESVVSKYFYEINNQSSLENIASAFSATYFANRDSALLLDIIKDPENKYGGAIMSYNLTNWETLVIRGDGAKSEYALQYEVQREHGKTNELFSLTKEDSVVKIIGYQISKSLVD